MQRSKTKRIAFSIDDDVDKVKSQGTKTKRIHWNFDDDPDKENKINLSGTSRGNIQFGIIAIDYAASISMFTNLMLLQYIQKLFKSILVHCGATKFCNTHVGNLHSSLWHLPLPQTGYNAYPNGVLNLLSLAHLKNTCIQ